MSRIASRVLVQRRLVGKHDHDVHVVEWLGFGVPNVRTSEEVLTDVQIGIELFTDATLPATGGTLLGVRRLESGSEPAGRLRRR